MLVDEHRTAGGAGDAAHRHDASDARDGAFNDDDRLADALGFGRCESDDHARRSFISARHEPRQRTRRRHQQRDDTDKQTHAQTDRRARPRRAAVRSAVIAAARSV